MELMKVLSNPVKLRIMQYVQENDTVTTKQIAEKLTDVPTATLYRHINTMLKEEILIIAEERKVRGSLERSIAVNKQMMVDVGNDGIAGAAYQFLMNLFLQFRKYEEKGNCDPIRDMLSMRICMLKLTDEKFYEMFNEWKDMIDKYQKEEDTLHGKMRSISFISAPTEQISKWKGTLMNEERVHIQGEVSIGATISYQLLQNIVKSICPNGMRVCQV